MRTTVQTESGSFRFIILLIVAMGACFWIGGQGVYTALKNRQPTPMAYQALSKGPPSCHWLVLTNCELHVGNSAYLIRKSKYDATGDGQITEAYVPIHSPGQSSDERCYAVMATKDAAILSLLDEMRHTKSPTAAAEFFDKHAKQLVVKRDVAGLVRFGVEEHNSEHSKLAGLRGNLAPDFIILNEGETPQLGTSVGLLLLGFFIVGGLVFMFKANQEPTTE
ncbi:MAG TPA: hypothetical protein VNH84_07695 [Candidatus Saccharimonadales bacterium]|nr:hypothetical protein [Candidatus Saccharimonadales bacterium]